MRDVICPKSEGIHYAVSQKIEGLNGVISSKIEGLHYAVSQKIEGLIALYPLRQKDYTTLYHRR
jgi:hypothetical protein